MTPVTFDLREVQRDYIRKVLADVPGRKCLVLDRWTAKTISPLFTMSELCELDVFLVERLDRMSDEKDSSSVQTVLLIPGPKWNL